MPTGNPSERPQGTVMTGCPVTLKGQLLTFISPARATFSSRGASLGTSLVAFNRSRWHDQQVNALQGSVVGFCEDASQVLRLRIVVSVIPVLHILTQQCD